VLGIHRFVGYAVVAIFAIGWVWPMLAWIARRGPGELYWRWVTVAQVVAGVQALFGGYLFVVDGLRASTMLHYAYGVFPLLAFFVAHRVARRTLEMPASTEIAGGGEVSLKVRPWVPFAWAAFFSFGLTLRALMTGLGIG